MNFEKLPAQLMYEVGLAELHKEFAEVYSVFLILLRVNLYNLIPCLINSLYHSASEHDK